jgi:hypothetical protein
MSMAGEVSKRLTTTAPEGDRPLRVGSGQNSTFCNRSSIELFIGHAMSSVKIYDMVTIKKLHKPIDFQSDGISVRAPIVGDVAAVIEVYTTPPGYELECSEKDGITLWLHAFAPEEVELEVVG